MAHAPAPSEADASLHAPPSHRRLWFIVPLTLLAIAIVAWGCYVWVTGEDGFDFRRFALQGKPELHLYPAGGTVTFNGAPVANGHVEARAAEPGATAAWIIGPIKEDGTFEFLTEVQGRFITGIPAGRYKLLLLVYHPPRPLEGPQQLLPAEYYDETRTPLAVTVTDDPDANQFVLEAAGEPQPRPERGGGPPGRGQPRSETDGEVPSEGEPPGNADSSVEGRLDPVNP